MIDIFMASILVALVQFGALVTINANVGAIAFASVVILTMFAARTFDPRLMWDAAQAPAPMSDQPGQHPTATVGARTSSAWRFSLIWVIPIVTAAIGAWLAWDTLSQRGPLITITFQTAEGLQAGQSHVRYKAVDMGLVEHIALTQDRQHVAVTVRMTSEADILLTKGTQFWVVKPRFFAGSISGLETLFSGAYIGMLPAKQRRRPEKRLHGPGRSAGAAIRRTWPHVPAARAAYRQHQSWLAGVLSRPDGRRGARLGHRRHGGQRDGPRVRPRTVRPIRA